MPNISIYNNVKQTKTDKTIPLDIFLDGIREGSWQDIVLKIRVIQDEKQRAAAKQKAPCVTIGGTFQERSDTGLIQHSGYIAIDIDHVDDIDQLKSLVCADRYVYAAFVSISGRGLCLIFKINPAKHRESFQGISEYLFQNYQVIADPTSINVSRLRFVSYDPFVYVADHVEKFVSYPKNKPPKKIEKVIYSKNDFEQILEQIQSRRLNLCENYHEWLRIAFSFVHQFGEAGRGYFHQVSQYSSKYDGSMTDKQYTSCLKHKGTNQTTIATFYYYCKTAGIQLYSQFTKRIAAATSTMKKSGVDAKSIAKNLKQFEGIEGEEAEDIIQQAFTSSTNFAAGESIVENVRMWLRHNFNLKRNVITRKVENNGAVLEEVDFNQMFTDCKIVFEKLDIKLFTMIIHSHNTPSFNPIQEILESWQWDGIQRIDVFGASINSDTGSLGWRCKMVQKWIIGIIHSIYGGYNELNFVLVGGKNTGKTEFFRRLLPKELQPYFATSQLTRGKDDEVLMCEKLIILNDEYGGKNKPDARNEKRLMASDRFDLRRPYGKGNETINRIASLCGTCNSIDVLDDPTGNRRIIVMDCIGQFDFEYYNSIDKKQLFAEAKILWQAGERPVLTHEEIRDLEAHTDCKFQKVSFEGEMIQKFFKNPDECLKEDFMTSTDIKNYLEGFTKEKIVLNKLGSMLGKMGFKRFPKNRVYGYQISKKNTQGMTLQYSVTQNEEPAF